jgi:hypothetical protein
MVRSKEPLTFRLVSSTPRLSPSLRQARRFFAARSSWKQPIAGANDSHEARLGHAT